MTNLKISIITITHNSEKTVRDTFDSVCKQNYNNLEYIVVDGGSTDATLEIAREYRNIITLLISEPDNGISDAMNKGIQKATGDLIGIIHSDDMLSNEALNIVAKHFDYGIDVLYGNVSICDINGKMIHTLKADKDISKLQYEFCMNHPSIFVNRKAYERYGVFDLSLKCAMDYELFLRFYKNNAKFKFIDNTLAVYRMGGTNQKMRIQTINEVRDVSVKYGANRYKADIIRLKKIFADKVRPFLKCMKLKNKRVVKYENNSNVQKGKIL